MASSLFPQPAKNLPLKFQLKVTPPPLPPALEGRDQLKTLNNMKEMTVGQGAYWWNGSHQKTCHELRYCAEKVPASRNKRQHMDLVACHFLPSLVRTRHWAEITCKVPQALVRSDGNPVRQASLLPSPFYREHTWIFKMRSHYYRREGNFYTWYGQAFVPMQAHNSLET